jgi:hypothetical protein
MLLLSTLASTAASIGTVVAEFVVANYTWDAAHTHADYAASGQYQVDNNAVTGIKVSGQTIFLTVPRWRPGVPSTLNVLQSDSPPLLVPWPSWDLQEEGNCSAIQYVQSMEIDLDGVMWVVDVGRRNFVGFTPDNMCPPKMVLIDVASGQVVETFIFPDAAASYTASFLNDIVIDTRTQRAFISDAGTGAVVVYDRLGRNAWRFADATTQYDPSYAFTIEGVAYGNSTFVTPTDGIALTPDRSRVVYCALQGVLLWSVSAAVLGDPTNTLAQVQATQLLLGAKPSPSDGIVFDCAATLWFGGLTTSALYAWPFSLAGGVSNAEVVQADAATLHWVDTFAFDGAGGLYITSNKLDLFLAFTMDFSGATYASVLLCRTRPRPPCLPC